MYLPPRPTRAHIYVYKSYVCISGNKPVSCIFAHGTDRVLESHHITAHGIVSHQQPRVAFLSRAGEAQSLISELHHACAARYHHGEHRRLVQGRWPDAHAFPMLSSPRTKGRRVQQTETKSHQRSKFVSRRRLLRSVSSPRPAPDTDPRQTRYTSPASTAQTAPPAADHTLARQATPVATTAPTETTKPAPRRPRSSMATTPPMTTTTRKAASLAGASQRKSPRSSTT